MSNAHVLSQQMTYVNLLRMSMCSSQQLK